MYTRSFGEKISGASLKANLGVSLTIPLTGVPIGFCTGTWAAKPKKARGYLMVTVTVCAGFSEQFILDHTNIPERGKMSHLFEHNIFIKDFFHS